MPPGTVFLNFPIQKIDAPIPVSCKNYGRELIYQQPIFLFALPQGFRGLVGGYDLPSGRAQQESHPRQAVQEELI
jgi:hypothetical protein